MSEQTNNYRDNPFFENGAPKAVLQVEDRQIIATNPAFRDLFELNEEIRGCIQDILDITNEDGSDIKGIELTTFTTKKHLAVKISEDTIKQIALTISNINQEEVLLEVADRTKDAEKILELENNINTIEQKVQKLEEKLKEIKIVMENSNNILYSYDPNQKEYGMISSNLEKILRYSGDELKQIRRDNGILSLIFEDDKERFKKYWHNIMDSDKTAGKIDFRMMIKGNGEIWLSDTYKIIRDENGQIEKVIGNIHNIDKEKRLQNIGRLVRHDVYNEIAVIKSGLKILQKGILNDQKNKEVLSTIDKRATKVVTLLDELKRVSEKIGNNPKLISMNLQTIAQETVKNYSDSDIEIDINGTESNTILAERSLFFVINTIIDNAKRHGGATKIYIRTEIPKDGSIVALDIENNGTKIPEKVLGKIFNQGFTHGKTGHTGEGLFLAKEIVENHMNGYIEVSNTDKGVEFRLLLPRVEFIKY